MSFLWMNCPIKYPEKTEVVTSSMTTQICLTHSMMESGVPAMVMALSVELGSMSPATCTWAPVDLSNRESDTLSSIKQLTKMLWNNYWWVKEGAGGVKQVNTYLSDLFDLAATFTNKRTTLAGWHNNAQCDRRLWGCCTVGHGAAYVLKISKEGKKAVSFSYHIFHFNLHFPSSRVLKC